MHWLSIPSVASAWAVLLLAGVLEVVFALFLKLSAGFSRTVPSVLCIAAGVGSVWLLSLTLKFLPLGTAYAVWAAIGVAGSALVGMAWFGEPASAGKLACLALVGAGIVGLQLQSGS